MTMLCCKLIVDGIRRFLIDFHLDTTPLFLAALLLRDCTVGVFRFWTFLKSSCFRSLYDALDLKNDYCAKKIRKFYLLAIAHGG